jgi:multidrug transporter EmrE-like cation transporter
MNPDTQTSLTLAQLIGLVTFAISMATGQVLFKLGATRAAPATDLDGWISLIFQPIVITALALYGAATFLWLWLLQKIPLTTAYPFAALAFVLVPFGGWLFFNESINIKYLGGVSLILAGVILTSLSKSL